MAFQPRKPTSASRELRMYKDCPQRWGSFPSGIRSTVCGFLYSSSTWQRKWQVQGQNVRGHKGLRWPILGEHTDDLQSSSQPLDQFCAIQDGGLRWQNLPLSAPHGYKQQGWISNLGLVRGQCSSHKHTRGHWCWKLWPACCIPSSR